MGNIPCLGYDMTKNVKTFTLDGYQVNGQLPSKTRVAVMPSGAPETPMLSRKDPSERFVTAKTEDWAKSFISSGDLATALDYPVELPATSGRKRVKVNDNMMTYDYEDDEISWLENNCCSPDSFTKFGDDHKMWNAIKQDRWLSEVYARLWWTHSSYRAALRITYGTRGEVAAIGPCMVNNLAYAANQACRFADGLLRVVNSDCYYTIGVSNEDIEVYRENMKRVSPEIDELHETLLRVSTYVDGQTPAGNLGRQLELGIELSTTQCIRRTIAANSRVRLSLKPKYYCLADDRRLTVHEVQDNHLLSMPTPDENALVIHGN